MPAYVCGGPGKGAPAGEAAAGRHSGERQAARNLDVSFVDGVVEVLHGFDLVLEAAGFASMTL